MHPTSGINDIVILLLTNIWCMSFFRMPTDGTDFGRTRPCYGKAYTMARDGADDADVAECVMRGVELDIRRDGGAPAFPVAVELLVVASCVGNNLQLLSGVDAIRRDFVDSPLTRHIAAAVETLGLTAFAEGRSLSAEEASEKLLVQIAQSRCCDGMTGYIARNRTRDLSASQAIVGSIKANLAQTNAVRELAVRMLNCSPKGLPARAPKASPVTHTAEGLSEEI